MNLSATLTRIYQHPYTQQGLTLGKVLLETSFCLAGLGLASYGFLWCSRKAGQSIFYTALYSWLATYNALSAVWSVTKAVTLVVGAELLRRLSASLLRSLGDQLERTARAVEALSERTAQWTAEVKTRLKMWWKELLSFPAKTNAKPPVNLKQEQGLSSSQTSVGRSWFCLFNRRHQDSNNSNEPNSDEKYSPLSSPRRLSSARRSI